MIFSTYGQSRRKNAALAAAAFSVLLPVLFGLSVSACSKRDSDAKAKAPPATARIVVLSPAVAVTARDLGLSALIVGRHGYDLALDRSLPVCGDFAGIDYETLLGASPTHVFIEWGSRPLPDRLQSLAAANSWAVEQFALLTLDDIRSSVKRIGETFPSCAPRAKETLAAMDRAWTPGKIDVSRAGAVLLLHTVAPPTVLGPGSFHHQVLTSLGGVAAIKTGSPYMELDAEDMARLNPPCILIVSARAPEAPGRRSPVMNVEEASTLFGAKLGASLDAVRRGRVAVLDNPLALLPSTSMIELADEMRRVLEPWAEAK